MIIKKQARQKEVVKVQQPAEPIENVAVVEEEKVQVQVQPQAPVQVQEQPVQQKVEPTPLQTKTQEELQNDAFNIDKIDFTQRQERRRGDRRRGYRRIDDRNLISRAQEEADQIKEAAAKEGYRAGLEESKQDILNLRNAITDLISSKKEIFEYIAPDILEISVDIARKIIKKEIEQNPETIIGMILEVMDNLSKDETKVTIKVNPMQADLVREELPKALKTKGTEARINVLADENIETGGCLFQTNNGIIDANLRTQIEILKEALRGI